MKTISKAATIQDVAKAAGVSVATVSRVVNSYPYVAEATRQRVLEAVEAIGFRPNALARSLVRSRSEMIGLVVPDITAPFYPGVVRGAEQAASALGYSVMLCNTDQNWQREEKNLALLQERQAEGVIFLSAAVTERHVAAFAGLRCPVVLVSTEDPHGQLPCVVLNNEQAAFDATEHLLACGCRRLAMIAGPPADPIAGAPRLVGFRKALAQHGLTAGPEVVAYGDYRFDAGYRAMQALLARRPVPDGVFCASDEMAAGALAACYDHGIAVPDDVALVGFDDTPLSAMLRPQLTTVAQPLAAMGETAMRVLHRLIRGQAPANRRIVLAHQLVVRASSMR